MNRKSKSRAGFCFDPSMKLLEASDMKRFFLLLIPFVPVIMLMVLSILLFSNTYESFIAIILDSLQRPDIAPRLRDDYFPEEKFLILKKVSLLLTLCGMLGLILLIRFRQRYFRMAEPWIQHAKGLVSTFRQTYHRLSSRSRSILFGIILLTALRSVYYAGTFYIQYDEAWNDQIFLLKHWFYSVGAYNNYPLHNLISWVFIQFFGHSVWVLRLPSILAGIVSVFVLSILLFHLTQSEWLALSGALLFACLPASVFYMLYARGVLFEIFFSLLVSGMLYYYVQKSMNRYGMATLVLLNALGTFSMLTHPLFIIASGVAWFIYCAMYQRSTWWYPALYVLLSLLFSALLLLPMMLGTGLSPGVNAAFGQTVMDFHSLSNYGRQCSFFITGNAYILFGCGILLLIFMFTSFRKNKALFFLSVINIALLISPMAIALITSKFLPERSVSYLVIVPLSVWLVVAHLWIKQFQETRWLLLPFALLILVLSYATHTHPFMNWSKKLDEIVWRIADRLMQSDIETVYNDHRDFDYYIPGITYYYHLANRQIRFSTSAKNSTRFTALPASDVQCIVTHPAKKWTGFIEADTIYLFKEMLILSKPKS